MTLVHIRRGTDSAFRRTLLNPALWVGILIGVPVGTVLALPIFGTHLDDGIANLIGAVSGAALALVGAFWLWHVQDQRASRELGGGVIAILLPLQAAIGALLTDAAQEHEGELDEGEGKGRIERIERLPTECRLALARLKRLEPHFGRLDFDGTISLFNLEEAIDALLENFQQIDVMSHGIRRTLEMQINSALKIQPQLELVQKTTKDAIDHFAGA